MNLLSAEYFKESLGGLGKLGLSLNGLAFGLSPRQEDVDGTKVTADRVSAQLGVLVTVLQQSPVSRSSIRGLT